MNDFKNPIPYKARSVIYLVGLVVAAMSIFIPALLLGSPFEPWIPTVTAVFGLTGAVTAVLAKANLTQDDKQEAVNNGDNTEDLPVTPEEYRDHMLRVTRRLQEQPEETEGYDADPVQYETRRARREAEER